MTVDRQTFKIKRGDTAPAIAAQLVDANFEPVVLEGNVTGIRFLMRPVASDEIVIAATAQVSDDDTSVAVYQWVSGDTDNAGNYAAEFEVTWDDARVETYPNGDSYIDVLIGRDIG